MREQTKAYVYMAVSMAIVGSLVVVAKVLVDVFPVFLVSGLRFAVAAAITVPAVLRTGGFSSLTARDWGILSVQSFVGVFLFSVFMLYGLRFTTAAESGIVTSTIPAVTVLVSYLLLREKPTRFTAAGIALAVLGVAAINLVEISPAAGRGPNPMLGNLLIFGSVVGEAVFVVVGKILSERIGPLMISAVMSLFGFLLFLPLALYEANGFEFHRVTAVQWALVLYYGTVATVGSFLLWYKGISRVPASTAGVFPGVIPVSALLLSYLVLREPFLWSHLFGGASVMAGIGLIAFGEQDHPDCQDHPDRDRPERSC